MRVSKTNAERNEDRIRRLAANQELSKVHRKFAWWPTWVRDTGGRVWLEYVWRYADLYDTASCNGEIMWFNNFTTKEAADSSREFIRRFKGDDI